MSSNRVVIFSKSADWGKVKTRLRQILTEDECLSLHIALLKDTLGKLNAFHPTLYLTGSGYLPWNVDVPVCAQTGSDLGERLSNAFGKEFNSTSKVVIVGTDSPTFPAEMISRAFTLLDKNDAVFGPSEDGGYYLIGLRTMIPEIFQSISWGNSAVLKETLERIGLHSYALLETYFDVDTAEDLTRLERELETKPELKYLNEWMRDRRR